MLTTLTTLYLLFGTVVDAYDLPLIYAKFLDDLGVCESCVSNRAVLAFWATRLLLSPFRWAFWPLSFTPQARKSRAYYSRKVYPS